MIKGTGLLDQITSEYNYLSVIGKLKRGIEPTIVADLCGISETKLESKLKEKGYTLKGEPINAEPIDVKKDTYTPITSEIKKLLLSGLKKGYDTDFLIEKYHLERKKATGVLLDLRRKMKVDEERLYPLSSIKGKQGKYKTMFTIKQQDLT